MRYRSTRAPLGAGTARFSQILLEGLAPDGGLYVPEQYPQLDNTTLERWRRTLTEDGYAALAATILELFIDDIPRVDLLKLCRAAYTPEAFGTPEIVPVDRLGQTNLYLARTSNGPTAAFKDMAMQLLGQLFEYQLEQTDSWLTVLGATSGDTGSAAEYAMLGRDRVRIAMLTPAGRMTPFQRAQMFSLNEPNIANVAIDGVFDDCQDLVKAVNADANFKQRWHIGAVNSINWARLVAQVVYYVAAWLRVTSQPNLAQARVSFAVPTGNFGNILAGHVARQMGLPIDRLILATNENNVLDEFFQTGLYRPRSAPETHPTSSPSMDISKASNFERFIFDLFDGDGRRVADLFARQLPENGYFDLTATPQFAGLAQCYGFISGSSTHADRLATIAQLWQDHRVLIDPHTADAVKVANQLNSQVAANPDHTDPEDQSQSPIVIMETALPVKFAQTITTAIGQPPPIPDRFSRLEQAQQHVTNLPNDVAVLKTWLENWLMSTSAPGLVG